jgi:hypothetical protein
MEAFKGLIVSPPTSMLCPSVANDSISVDNNMPIYWIIVIYAIILSIRDDSHFVLLIKI